MTPRSTAARDRHGHSIPHASSPAALRALSMLSVLWLIVPPVEAFEPKSQPFAAVERMPVNRAPTPAVVKKNPPQCMNGEQDGLDGFSLRAILLNGDDSYANLDGRLIRLGDTLHGWRLMGLDLNEATFTCKRQRRVLILQRSQAAPTTAAPVLPVAQPAVSSTLGTTPAAAPEAAPRDKSDAPPSVNFADQFKGLSK